jgi:hypothetical protein
MLGVYFMEGHNSLRLTSLSLLYRFVYVLYIWTILLLQYTFWQKWSRLETLYNELLYIINFDLYTVSMTLFESTEQNITFSHVIYIWILIFLLNTYWHVWSRLVTLCYKLLYIISFDLYTVSMTFWCNLTQSHSFSRSLHLDSIITSEHVLSGMVSHSNVLYRITLYYLC